MKLEACLDIADGCGLETVGEAIYNVDLRAGQIFEWSKIGAEMTELIADRDKMFSETGYDINTPIGLAIEWCKGRNK